RARGRHALAPAPPLRPADRPARGDLDLRPDRRLAVGAPALAARVHACRARRDAGSGRPGGRRLLGELGRRRARRGLTRHPALAQVKKRLDVLLVERGLAQSRAQAQALVLAGRVPGYAKAGAQVEEGTELSVTASPR